jgi:hypothetical protein
MAEPGRATLSRKYGDQCGVTDESKSHKLSTPMESVICREDNSSAVHVIVNAL